VSDRAPRSAEEEELHAEVRAVEVSLVRPLRASVLRPGRPPESSVYPLDEDPRTIHVAAILGGRVVSIGSAMPDGHPREPRPGDWRIRGMASEPGLRGRGLGGRVLARCERHVREHGGRRLWCNARIGARSFYERAGWMTEGEAFEIAGIGEHLVMARTLA
jgi:GNAT superfamily N-acetyltransferase